MMKFVGVSLLAKASAHIAKTEGISRNTVKKYCDGNAVTWERKMPDRESTILTPDVLRFIQNCLDENSRQGLKKQKILQNVSMTGLLKKLDLQVGNLRPVQKSKN